MKALIYSLSFLFLIHFSANSQKAPELSKGKTYQDSKWTYVNSVFGYDESGYYAFSDVKFKERLEKYDRSFNKLTTVNLELKSEKFKGREERSTFYSGNKIHIISSSWDKKTKTTSFFTETLDKNTLLTNNDVSKICDFSATSEKLFSTVRLSDDQLKILLIQNLSSGDKASEKYGVCAYSCNEAKVLYQEEVSLPNSDKFDLLINSFISNSGNAFLYFNLYEDNGVAVEISPFYQEHIFCITNSGKEKKDVSIPNSSKKLRDTKIAENLAGDVVVAGFYAMGAPNEITGCYFTLIDHTTGKASPLMTATFSDTCHNVGADKLLLLNDGSWLLLGEESHHSHQTNPARSYSGGYTPTLNDPVNPITGQHDAGTGFNRDIVTTSNSYFFGKIIVVCFDKTGEVKWNKLIQKNQFFTVPGEYGFSYVMYASYGTLLNSDRLHLIFNDHINNLTKRDEKLTDEFQRKAPSALIDVSINLVDGSYTKEALQKSSENPVLFRPGGSKQIAEKEIVMFGSNEDDHQGMTIKF